MRLCKVCSPGGRYGVAVWDELAPQPLNLGEVENVRSLSDILFAPDPVKLANYLLDPDGTLPTPEFSTSPRFSGCGASSSHTANPYRPPTSPCWPRSTGRRSGRPV
jgi:hypothetical protein